MSNKSDITRPPYRYCPSSRNWTRCQADDDGYCEWTDCPQIRDNEPHATGRHCPLDMYVENEE